MSYVTSINYDDSIPLDLPEDVVQWRLEIVIDEMAYLHLARGNGNYELRYMKKVNNRYVACDKLVKLEKEGGDGATVFIEWEKHFGEE